MEERYRLAWLSARRRADALHAQLNFEYYRSGRLIDLDSVSHVTVLIQQLAAARRQPTEERKQIVRDTLNMILDSPRG